MKSTSVSVVVPAYNCEKTILDVLNALLVQSYPNIEIIVVDDGSTDHTAEIVQSLDRVKYIYQKNAGPATARNLGARKATGDVIAFTDSDCIATIDWIKNAVSGFKHDEIAVVAGSYGIANSQNRLARCVHAEILYRHHHLMPEYPKAFGSYNFAIRREVFEKIGGFNESYRFASGEDNDLSYKVTKAGYKIFFERNSIVAHVHPVSIQKYLKEQYRHGFWRVKMYFDHPKMMKGDDYTFWKDIIEIPMVLSVALSLMLTIVSPLLFVSLAGVLLVAMYLIELVFCLKALSDWMDRIYFSCVLYLRAFFRTFGLSSGVIHFKLKYPMK